MRVYAYLLIQANSESVMLFDGQRNIKGYSIWLYSQIGSVFV